VEDLAELPLLVLDPVHRLLGEQVAVPPVVGRRYLDSPERALVRCGDEKSQFQALDRSQPVLPGVPDRRGHDSVRAGTTTLFAALEVTTGQVLGSRHRRHRAAECRRFLSRLDREVPADLAVHPIRDDYVTHRVPVSKRWPPTRASPCTSSRPAPRG